MDIDPPIVSSDFAHQLMRPRTLNLESSDETWTLPCAQKIQRGGDLLLAKLRMIPDSTSLRRVTLMLAADGMAGLESLPLFGQAF